MIKTVPDEEKKIRGTRRKEGRGGRTRRKEGRGGRRDEKEGGTRRKE